MTDVNDYESIQRRYCSNSRAKKEGDQPGRMGQRLLENVDEAWVTVLRDAGGPILDVGCGDGLGMARFLSLGAPGVIGIEVVKDRVAVAVEHGLNVVQGMAEDLSGWPDRSVEVFCSHCLEHTRDQSRAMGEIFRVARCGVWLAVPVEPKGSGNPAHFSPVRAVENLLSLVPRLSDWVVVRCLCRFHLEREGVLAFKRKI